MSNSDARQHALEARDRAPLEATDLVSYGSAGRILAVGDDAALEHCDRLPPGLDIERVAAGADSVSIDGYLGAVTDGVTDDRR